MHLEYAQNCQSHFVNQARYRTEQFIVELVTARQAAYNTKKQKTMVQYQAVLQYFACIIVHLWAVNALRTWPQLHSRFVHQARQRIETFAVEFVTAKHSQYITT